MLMCLQKYYAAAETMADSVKKSGDLKMWVVLNAKPEITSEVIISLHIELEIVGMKKKRFCILSWRIIPKIFFDQKEG